ncbi:MAG: hypothetical protein KGZ83_01565 [Sulfuricella sp.]|nr:hypothetical protein [Sulfuricella sp.]
MNGKPAFAATAATVLAASGAAAQYLRNPAGGSEELLLKCQTNTREDVKCLR